MSEKPDYSYTRMDRPHTAGRDRKRLQFGGTFQVLFGVLFLGCMTLVFISQGFGYYFGSGFAAGAMLIIAGSVAVHKTRTSREPRHKPVKVLSILAAVLSSVILCISGLGVYFDLAVTADSQRVSSTISMAANIVMAFLGIWGLSISVWMILQSSTGGVEDSSKKEAFAAGLRTGSDESGGKWARSRKSLTGKDKVNYDQEKNKLKDRRKSSPKVAAVTGGGDGAKAAATGKSATRQSKAFDSISMNPVPSMKSGDSTGSDFSDDSYDDEGYDDSEISDSDEGSDETNMDGVDMNDPEAVAAARRRRRRRRRRKKFKKFELVKGEKKVTKAVDPFSKDRKIKRTWDKKPKNEFKLTKAQELRQKKMAEQKAKEGKK